MVIYANTGQVIDGLDIVLIQLNVGDKCRAEIPFDLAYGEYGYLPHVPPKAKLIYDIHIVEFFDR